MIRRISIQNFRTHLETVLKFSDGLNVIAGRTRSGKSNIIRAIVFNLFNRPSGVKIVSDVTPFKRRSAEVEVFYSEGKSIKIIREIKKGRLKGNFSVDTSYQILSGRGNVQEEFSKMKFSVPDSVKNLANISEINIQTQLSPHFLVTSSGGQITKEINKLTDFEKIDKLLAHLTTKINEGKRFIVVKTKDKESLEENLRSLKGLKDIGTDLQRLKDLSERHRDLKEKEESLHHGLLSRRELIKKASSLGRIKGFCDSLKNIDDLTSKLDTIDTKCTLIFVYLKHSESLKKIKKEYEETFSEYLDLLTEIKKCPICLSDIGKKEIERIKHEHL